MSEASSVSANRAGENRNNSGPTSWFEAMASAWGQALNRQADKVIERTNALGENSDEPSDIALLSAETFRFQYLSNASHTSLVSTGTALDTLARKQ